MPPRSLTFKVFLLCFISDLPAKASVLNFIQFNGYWGCARCEQKGLYAYYYYSITLTLNFLIGCRVSLESSGTIQVYPYNDSNPCGPV